LNVWQTITKLSLIMLTENKKRTHNSNYPKVAVQWLNQALCFYQSLCLVDSEVLRNRHLRVAANRWWQPQKDIQVKKRVGTYLRKPNMTKPKSYKNDNYSDSPLVWFSYQFSKWYNFVGLTLLVLGLSFWLGKVSLFITVYFSFLTWGTTQLLNLFIVIALRGPLIKYIEINNQNSTLTIIYKYPFGKVQTKILNHHSFSFRVWGNNIESMTTIKTDDFKVTIREGQFGLDILDLWNFNIELEKIGEKYKCFWDF
jgi:hypothetical protein